MKAKPFPALLEAVYETGETYYGREEKAWLLVNGQLQPSYYNFTYKALRDAGGVIYGIHHTAIDVTEQVLARLKVEESEKTLHNVILKAPVAMCILSGPQYVVEIANERMIEFWGRTAEDVLSRPIFEGLPEARDQGFEDMLNGVYTTGEAFAAYGMLITLPREGKIGNVYVNFVYEAYREADGTISGIIAVVSDVTQQVLARQKIEEIVSERTKELADANARLKQSNDELAQFAYIASHDLQEPIRKISTYLQMLDKSFAHLDAEQQNYIAKIAGAAKRMRTLIRDVLAFSELSKETNAFGLVNLLEIAEGVKSDFDLLIEQKGATVVFTGLPVIEAIPVQMSQLFGNLISNALKFTQQGVLPVITITATPIDTAEAAQFLSPKEGVSYFAITFRDNGIGFKPEHSEQIFNIFQRLHGKTEFAGTGIGLAMCKKIAQNHQGTMYATGEEGHGATFTAILPAKHS